MARRVGILCLLALTALAAVAHAAVVGGSATDPAGDSSQGPGTDITSASWTFDPDAGRLVVTVSFDAKPTESDWGAINAHLRDTSAPDCGGASFATIRANNRTTSVGASAGTYDDGVQPDGSQGPSSAPATNTKSDDGRTTTVSTQHERLVGRHAGCLSITVSHNGVKDSLNVERTGGNTGGGPSNGGAPTGGEPNSGQPPGNPSGPAGTPTSARLGSRKLRVRRRAVRASVVGATGGTTGTLRLLTGRTLLASGTYVARQPVPVSVRLKLTARGRRWLRSQRRAGKAKLVMRSVLGSEAATRTYTVRVLR